MHKKYPFDPSIKHHILIALGLALWVFLFLYFTEPIDVDQFNTSEKLMYLPIYGLIVAVSYLCFIPFQNWLYKKSQYQWKLSHEIVFLIIFLLVSMAVARLFYLFVIVPNEPYPYTLWYHTKSIFLPALTVILPILIIGRFAFGKYKNKKLEEQKIEIQGEGHYESLRLLLNDLICIQSSDNYVEVFYIDGTMLKKSLIRNTLSKVSNSFPELLRTHRSFVINPFHFKSWKTEKGKHFLLLAQDIEVPISKTYLDNVKENLSV
ncbi:LytTR family transcriptional regulator [Psychroserpens burtonensis]|uniref:LytTR family transcriptional regulator n=1 Tax=Psychroserpens burtonensis TaxID=49278 RepID=A0A5C7BBU0_9FLAO|nr:LytTR family DNA-binding domain-containing protein [Psychroserpens burtonensis]TXE20275.1 LytTR family transcriptional regulator [Psychroserpens burtonensis]